MEEASPVAVEVSQVAVVVSNHHHQLLVRRVVEGCADSGAVLRVLGNMEADVIEFLQCREHLLALGS